jgi:hypothetical protein
VGRFLARLGLVAAVAVSVLGVGGISQATEPEGYKREVFAWHLGDDFIAQQGFPTNSQAKAANGDVITIKGTGAFSLGPRAASGGGTLVHHVAATGQDETGTFQVRRLISFENYGSGVPQGTPPNFFGGKLVLAVDATPDLMPWKRFPAVLTIFCALGTVPAGVEEGATLNVKGIIDFNMIVPHSGANVYVKLA